MIKLQLDDSRRLTGKSLLADLPCAILDAFVSGVDKQKVVKTWQGFTQTILDQLEWHDEKTSFRIFEDGVSLLISAPIDALYAACEINEAAWNMTCVELAEKADAAEFESEHETLQNGINRIKACIAEESQPKLIELITLAEKNKVVYLWDDDEFSLGYGPTSNVWPATELPDPATIDWAQYKAIPIALVTGTNGKSTSVRILSHMVAQSGLSCGVTSTDFIRVGKTIIDTGDYSGPGGARMLLRHKQTETAILEVARGGILRRGLPIEHVDVSLVTNVAEDHLGQYGINTVEALAQVKLVVSKALTGGNLVLNADDPLLAKLAIDLPVNKIWFALSETNSIVDEHRKKGGAVCFMREGQLIFCAHSIESKIVAVNDIPMTLNGAAVHNIRNALGAIGVAKSLGISDEHIANALTSFSSSVEDNPGRGNQFDVKGAKVIMDFAHNVHSMDAMATTLANMPAKQKYLMLSMAGDRSDEEIINATVSALAMKPDILVAADLPGYLRGRLPGEVTRLIANAAQSNGMSEKNIIFSANPLDGATLIVDRLQPSDLALLLALSDRDKIIELLAAK